MLKAFERFNRVHMPRMLCYCCRQATIRPTAITTLARQQMQQPQEEPPVAAPTGMLSAFLRSCTATTARHVSPFAQAARSFKGAADSHQVQQEQQR